MPIALSIIFCLVSAPQQCQTILSEPTESAGAGLAQCAIQGQQFAAQWLEEHPKWFLYRVRCTIGNAPKQGNT
jgi:hypothetical protein